MTFDLTGLVIFLLAVMPGFVAQQSRYLIVPRSTEPKSAIEKMGDYVLNSVLVHLMLLATFGTLTIQRSVGGVPSPFQRDATQSWVWDHWRLVLLYFLASLLLGLLFGFLRGIIALKQPVRSALLRFRWCRWLLTKAGVHSFLESDPV